MGLAYLAALTVSIGCIGLIDHRHRLFLFRAPRTAALVLAVGVGYFLAWDLVGIGYGVFFRGQTSFMTGVLLAPELPVEEVFFLVLLCYLTMVAWLGAERWTRRSPT